MTWVLEMVQRTSRDGQEASPADVDVLEYRLHIMTHNYLHDQLWGRVAFWRRVVSALHMLEEPDSNSDSGSLDDFWCESSLPSFTWPLSPYSKLSRAQRMWLQIIMRDHFAALYVS